MSRKIVGKKLVHRAHDQGKLPRNLSKKTWSSVRGFTIAFDLFPCFIYKHIDRHWFRWYKISIALRYRYVLRNSINYRNETELIIINYENEKTKRLIGLNKYLMVFRVSTLWYKHAGCCETWEKRNKIRAAWQVFLAFRKSASNIPSVWIRISKHRKP